MCNLGCAEPGPLAWAGLWPGWVGQELRTREALAGDTQWQVFPHSWPDFSVAGLTHLQYCILFLTTCLNFHDSFASPSPPSYSGEHRLCHHEEASETSSWKENAQIQPREPASPATGLSVAAQRPNAHGVLLTAHRQLPPLCLETGSLGTLSGHRHLLNRF